MSRVRCAFYLTAAVPKMERNNMLLFFSGLIELLQEQLLEFLHGPRQRLLPPDSRTLYKYNTVQPLCMHAHDTAPGFRTQHP